MARRGKQKPPVEVTLDRLEAKGLSGLSPDGRRTTVRLGAVGQVVQVRTGRKDKAELLGVLHPAPDQVPPACPAFGLCGGCQLQAMPLGAQRMHKADLVARLVGHPCHGCAGADPAYGYRNKLELSWSTRRYLPQPPEDPAALVGSWLGFHPPGWFSRVVDLDGCPLGTSAMNAVIAAVRDLRLAPAWDNATHQGWWRHLVLRQGDDGLLVTLITTSDCPREEVERAGVAIAAVPGVESVLWRTNDGVAEVAEGPLRAVLHGRADLAITLRGTRLLLPAEAFFQVNTPGAEVLLDTIATALGRGGTLLDLYCGVGAIGLCLADRFDRVVGVELLDTAIEVARDNAARLGVRGQWHAGPVETVIPTLLPGLDLPSPRRVLVDPPRVGLHPRACAFLAGLDAEVLVYVACSPASLGRDRAVLEAGGWRLADLWAVDLFPQTRHVEAVARFVR